MSEQVVLLADDGAVIGSMLKSEVHTASTPLHLAFSCYVFDGEGRMLLTRRSLSKRAWPGVWTNACCGHPAPGEQVADAVVRRLREELGYAVDGVREVLPDFRYRAVDAAGIVENEVCPVFAVTVSSDPVADPAETMQWAWVDAEGLADAPDGGDEAVLAGSGSALPVPGVRASGAAVSDRSQS